MNDPSTFWLSDVPPMRAETHFDGRVVRCFVDRPKNTFALLSAATARNPGGEALICDSERLTYAKLDQRVAQYADGLAAHGIAQGDRVAVLLANGVAFPVIVFAALRLGAIAVPISIREQTPGIAYMLAHCGAKVVVCDADLVARLPAPDATPLLQHRLVVSAEGHCAELERVLGGRVTPAEVADEDTAIILYTSGTTGKPKGAMLTHLGICHSALHYQCCMGLTARDRCVIAVPLSHVTGVVALLAAMVHVGGAMIVMPAFKAADFLEIAERERMTHTLLVPAMYNLCLLDPRFERADLSAWRTGGFGGAPMAPATIERFAAKLPSLSLMNAYGSTETTSPATIMPPREAAARLDSVGRAVPCGEILIMDDDGREVPRGQAGEVWLRGPMVVKGYWSDPAATAANFTAGYWRSGDVGSLDREGYLRVFDRKKDMINRGGYKIYSIEVENALMAHRGVREAALVGRPCPVLGERAHAFICAVDGGTSAEDLRRHCQHHLADYKVPDGFSISAEPFPRNANGKILKRKLRDDLLAGTEAT